ncbi:hypothetical protein VTL71DRAFT_11836 [Oculimacula yallundae]|uniref:Transmembrane protein n=1 Tax=Oculimacula yallundae TaxID=86028 RepID=A0ABR4CRV8_9HELO
MQTHAMILLLLSLVLGVAALGGLARESPISDVKFEDLPSIQMGTNTLVKYTAYIQDNVAPDVSLTDFSLLLLQTTVDEDGVIETENTFKLAEPLPGICIAVTEDQCRTNIEIHPRLVPGNESTTPVTFKLGNNTNHFPEPKWLFFCFAHKNLSIPGHKGRCLFYSDVFSISNATDDVAIVPSSTDTTPTRLTGGRDGRNHKRAPPFIPNGAMEVLYERIDLIVMENLQTVITAAPTATTRSSMETTMSMITTVTNSGETSTTTASAATTVAQAESISKDNGLSTATKVGIALGALAFVLILLILALLFLRRKHAKRSTQPEQVMLTRSMHTDSFSRNLITEKADSTASAAATPIDEPALLPMQRHSALSPYSPLPSLPYTGAAATIPRRKPTAATMASTVSRGLSTTSETTSSGARSPRSGDDSFEQYHDVVPIYGDARHVPQVFVGSSGTEAARGVQSPFLEEEGMTPEEVARLEEEERRIDAAIAEAERR